MVGRSIHMKLRAIYICVYIEREKYIYIYIDIDTDREIDRYIYR